MAEDGYDDLDLGGDDLDEGGAGEGEPGGLRGIFSGSLVKVLLIVALLVVVFIVALIAGSIAGGRRSAEEGYKRDKEQAMIRKKPLDTFNLKEFLANTSDKDETHLVRIKLQLGYQKKALKLQTELNERRAQIRDLILLFFNDKKKEDMDNAAKKRKLKKSLMNRINSILINGQIEDIYYEEFSVN